MGQASAREKHAIGVAKIPLPRRDNPAAKRKGLYGAKLAGEQTSLRLEPAV